MTQNSKWVIFGASGFVGSAIYDALIDTGQEVVVAETPRLVAKGRTVETLFEDLKLCEADIRDVLMQIGDADVVVNAAGAATPTASDSDALVGANALLPLVIAEAIVRKQSNSKFIHLSSASVQGNTRTVSSDPYVQPFSPYSRSKALGEAVVQRRLNGSDENFAILRATSVQGKGRQTTESLSKIASSRLASVAAPGNYPTIVSSVENLAKFVHFIGKNEINGIVLQPWEGHTVKSILFVAGKKTPMVLPKWVCKMVLKSGDLLSRISPGLAGHFRRLELMWFGQDQTQDQTGFEFDAGALERIFSR